MIIHHLFSNKPLVAFLAPENSVPAIGWPGIKSETFLISENIFFEKIFLTEPTSVTIEPFLRLRGFRQ